jgi:predicted transposase/invertase (TIGR01784 family)
LLVIARHTYGGTMPPSPHDALFKAIAGQIEHARALLRSLLPPAVAEALDWQTLALCPGSFVDPVLRGRHADLLFSLTWHGGEAALVYVLFEHQSTSDELMPFRLLRYLVRIWERWLKDHRRAKQLPVVMPIVLYHGKEPWSAPMVFDALFAIPDAARAALAPYLVRLTYLLDDVSEIPDDQLRARAVTALSRLLIVCFRDARDETAILDAVLRWADAVREVLAAPDGFEALEQVMRYIVMVNDRVSLETLQATLERAAGPEAKDILMTLGERLIQQGERRLLLRQLRQRFGDQVNADIEQRIAAASQAQIDTWGSRVLSAATLSELLRDGAPSEPGVRAT